MLVLTRSETRGLARGLPFICLVIGLIGSVMSGGRAIFIVCGVTIAGVLIIRKRFAALFISTLTALSAIFILNVFSHKFEEIGGNLVTRSVSWLIFSEETSAKGDIDASTRWRQFVLEDALKVWTESTRNLLIGRGYQGFSEAQYLDLSRMGYFEAIRIAVQRGASHSLIADCLLITGLIGLVLYYTTIVLGIRLGWRAAHERVFSPFTRDVGWAICFILAQRLTIGSIGGGLTGMTLDFLLIVTLLVSATRDQSSLESSNFTPEGIMDESTYA